MTLIDKIREVMSNPEIMKQYPNGISAAEMVQYTREDFPLCTAIDCADEMRKFYGNPRG